MASADTIRNLTEVPTPNDNASGLANATNKMLAAMRHLVFDKDDTSKEGYTAAANGYTSNSTSESTHKSHASRLSNHNRAKSCERSNFRRQEDNTTEKNPCRHCKKYGRHNHQPNVPAEKCFWNKKWKGFHPRYVFKALNTRFNDRDTFALDLGGYESSGGESYKSA